VTVGSAAPFTIGDLAGIQASLNVTNTQGQTALVLGDMVDGTFRAPILYSGAVTALAPKTIMYTPSRVSSLTIVGGSANNIYNVVSTPVGTTTTILANTGNDTFNVGNMSHGLDDVQGPVTVNGWAGTDTVHFKDQASLNGHSYFLTASTLLRSGAPLLTFTTVAQVTVALGQGTNIFTIGMPVPAFAVSVIGNSTGTNSLIGPNVANSWVIKSAGGGTVGTITFSAFQNLYGGNNVDTFRLLPAGSLAGLINGAGAPAGKGDWLDYSAFATPVVVDLATGAATNVAGGVALIQNVLGGSGGNQLTGNAQGNILVGGSGNDVLVAGSGRSLLIGGGGNDHLVGGADEDLLISGTTAFDTKVAALMTILREWQRTDKTYTQRIADLRNGGGYNGNNVLVAGTTVFDDGVADVLAGGTGMDWFWANLSTDSLLDWQAGEQVN
jgi:hypothetical protein